MLMYIYKYEQKYIPSVIKSKLILWSFQIHHFLIKFNVYSV